MFEQTMALEGTHLLLAGTWLILWGVLWAVYFALDGYDLGIGMLMPFLAKNDTEKRVMYNAVGPFWDGNEVWLLAAGGVTFAAFPSAYAVMFSWLYTPLMLLLFALILRGVSFEFRSKVESPSWRKAWDLCQSVGSFLPALLLGVAFANIFKGLPFNAEYTNTGTVLDLLNPYGLAGGVVFVLLFLSHGALWLANRGSAELRPRGEKVARILWPVLLVVIVAFLAYTWVETKLFGNYLASPALFLVLAVPVAALLMMRFFMNANKWWLAWGSSSLMIIGVTMFGVVGLYPALLPSNPLPQYSVTIHNAASSELTLKIMLGVALVFVPIVLLYQAWAMKKFSHPVDPDDLKY